MTTRVTSKYINYVYGSDPYPASVYEFKNILMWSLSIYLSISTLSLKKDFVCKNILFLSISGKQTGQIFFLSILFTSGASSTLHQEGL